MHVLQPHLVKRGKKLKSYLINSSFFCVSIFLCALFVDAKHKHKKYSSFKFTAVLVLAKY